jgi:hypothetical protein
MKMHWINKNLIKYVFASMNVVMCHVFFAKIKCDMPPLMELLSNFSLDNANP